MAAFQPTSVQCRAESESIKSDLWGSAEAQLGWSSFPIPLLPTIAIVSSIEFQASFEGPWNALLLCKRRSIREILFALNSSSRRVELSFFVELWSDAELPLMSHYLTWRSLLLWLFLFWLVWPLKGNSHHPHFYSVLLDSHNEVSFEVSFGGGGRGNVTLEKKRD